jgi:hypothetical protein
LATRAMARESKARLVSASIRSEVPATFGHVTVACCHAGGNGAGYALNLASPDFMIDFGHDPRAFDL